MRRGGIADNAESRSRQGPSHDAEAPGCGMRASGWHGNPGLSHAWRHLRARSRDQGPPNPVGNPPWINDMMAEELPIPKGPHATARPPPPAAAPARLRGLPSQPATHCITGVERDVAGRMASRSLAQASGLVRNKVTRSPPCGTGAPGGRKGSPVAWASIGSAVTRPRRQPAKRLRIAWPSAW